MSKHLLFYNEEESRQDNEWGMMDRWITMFGMIPVVIDRDPKRWNRSQAAIDRLKRVYPVIQDAFSEPEFRGHSWVFLEANASLQFIDEYSHPPDNVIYCIGSDNVGFDGMTKSELDAQGVRVTLRTIRPGASYYGSFVVPLVAYDVFLFSQGRRA